MEVTANINKSEDLKHKLSSQLMTRSLWPLFLGVWLCVVYYILSILCKITIAGHFSLECVMFLLPVQPYRPSTPTFVI